MLLTEQISGKKYKVVSEWSEITLADAIEVSRIVMPDKLKEIYENPTEEFLSTCTDELFISFSEFYKEVLAILTDIPKDVAENIDDLSLYKFFQI